jgi:hypothetical protein
MNTELKSLRLDVRARYNQAAPELHKKGKNVEPDEVAGKTS